MSVISIINTLLAKKIQISEANGRLLVDAPKGVMTEELASLVRANKQALLTFLKESSDLDALGIQREAISPVAREQGLIMPLSFAQQRLWFIDQLQGSSAEYNMPAAFRLKGRFDICAAEKAITQIIDRHEVLRTVFKQCNDDSIHPEVEDSFTFTLNCHDLTDLDFIEQQYQLRELMRVISSAV